MAKSSISSSNNPRLRKHHKRQDRKNVGLTNEEENCEIQISGDDQGCYTYQLAAVIITCIRPILGQGTQNFSMA